MRRSVILPVLISVGGWSLVGCHQPSAPQQQWLAEGLRFYHARQYAQSVQQLTRVVQDSRASADRATALYVRALAYAATGQRLPARADLVQCVESAADPELRWRALTTLGTIDYEDGQWSAAARYYGAALTNAPRSPPADEILFRLGACCERGGRWDEARRYFQQVADQFPSSPHAAGARRRLELGATHFAVQCGVFSNRANADSLARELTARGLNAYVRQEPRGGAERHVVLVGRYRSYQQALEELGRVKGYVSGAVLWP